MRHPSTLVTLCLLTAFAAFTAARVAAQAVPAFELIAEPALPLAGERVTVTVLPANFAISTTTVFTWFRDGVRILAASGPGRAAFIIATDPTEPQTIEVRVEANPGTGFSRREKSITVTTFLNPAQQTGGGGGLGEDFTLEASNINPNAGETVSISVTTFAFDRSTATYRWYINGVLDRAASGRGQTRLIVPSPAEGASKTVRVDATTPSGAVRSQSITVRTVSMPVYWWADTAVPYWYRGKALPTLNARVTAMAVLPRGRDATQLSYRWLVNDEAVAAPAGSRQTFSFLLDLPVKEEITVRVRDELGSLDKTTAFSIAPIAPQVGIYEVRPLRGAVYETILRRFAAPSGEPHDFAAAPFFFPRAGTLGFRWNLNGKEIPGEPPDPWKFILTSRPNAPAIDSLSIMVEDPQHRELRALANFSIELR